MLEEFKKFALRGNVVDLAVGVIIGAAFGGIVHLAGRRHHHAGDRRRHRRARLLQLLHSALRQGDGRHAWPRQKSKALYWLGAVFSPSAINFIIIAFVLFLAIRAHEPADAQRRPKRPPPPSKQEQLLTEIRDLLKSR